MIELRSLCKRYRTTKGVKTVLDDISLVFPPGRNMGILGRNGAGKSTLLRMISGAELPTSGEVIRTSSVSWLIGFSGGFHGSLTGRENLRFICRIYNADIPRVTAFVEEFSELGDYMEMPVNTYSSGMKAKLAFGLSMAIDFDYYRIDEVTAVGDAVFKKKSKAEFDRRKDRSTLLVVSHSVSTIREHCDAAAVLDRGR
ncbi:ABC transporter ATP-binding protein, partial [Trichloromonas sp.]|uniref:ABC transporter ATP-binding protein n=1 Tax=Trichloromonas sp. TaxID=3069249 RepID=UPI003D812973